MWKVKQALTRSENYTEFICILLPNGLKTTQSKMEKENNSIPYYVLYSLEALVNPNFYMHISD